MKKHIITTLLLSNIAWAMEPKKQLPQTTSEKNGWDIINDINRHSGIIHKSNHKYFHSNLFTVHKSPTNAKQETPPPPKQSITPKENPSQHLQSKL